MYASAMKFCGAMELCGIGYPTNQPADHQWPDVEAQMAAQKAGVLIAMTRGHKPVEAELMVDKGFAPVYEFTNPRTGTRATIWIKDLTKDGGPITKLPEKITVPRNVTDRAYNLRDAIQAASTGRARSSDFATMPSWPVWEMDPPPIPLAATGEAMYNAPVVSDSPSTPPASGCTLDNPCSVCAGEWPEEAPF